jgi:hypothetical protein
MFVLSLNGLLKNLFASGSEAQEQGFIAALKGLP